MNEIRKYQVEAATLVNGTCEVRLQGDLCRCLPLQEEGVFPGNSPVGTKEKSRKEMKGNRESAEQQR